MKKLIYAKLLFIDGSEWKHKNYDMIFNSYEDLYAYCDARSQYGDELKIEYSEEVNYYE